MPTRQRIQTPIGPVSPLQVYLVHDAESGLLALYAHDPYHSCTIGWSEDQQRFIDPCHGSYYMMDGTYIKGPAPRGLDRLAVEVTERGEVLVDLNAYRLGPAW